MPKSVAEVLKEGDIIFAEPASEKTIKSKNLTADAYELRQLPNVEGALIVMDPHTGKVLSSAAILSANLSLIGPPRLIVKPALPLSRLFI